MTANSEIVAIAQRYFLNTKEYSRLLVQLPLLPLLALSLLAIGPGYSLRRVERSAG